MVIIPLLMYLFQNRFSGFRFYETETVRGFILRGPNLSKPGVPDRGDETSPIDGFLEQAAKAPSSARAKLIFAIDATMSRQPLWDMAQGVQAEMFAAAEVYGGLDLQLVYYRGFSECRASKFVSQGAGLSNLMAKIKVKAGATQIEKILVHARSEQKNGRVKVLIFIGDAIEEEPGVLYDAAGQLGLLGVKIFVFQEGRDHQTEAVFRQIARLTGGAYAAFDLTAPKRLAALLGAAAAYAVGGLEALQGQSRPEAQLLLSQMK